MQAQFIEWSSDLSLQEKTSNGSIFVQRVGVVTSAYGRGAAHKSVCFIGAANYKVLCQHKNVQVIAVQ